MTNDQTVLPFPEGIRTNDADTVQRGFAELNRSIVRDFDEHSRNVQTPEVFGYRSPEERPTKQEISIDELYRNLEFTSTEFQTALRLLGQGVKLAERAVFKLQQADVISSQENILVLQSFMPELFACRGLGEGYAALINCVQLALINRHGIPLSLDQAHALRDILEATRKAPFMNFERARLLIRQFQKHDFVVEPLSLQFLTRFFDD